MFRNLMKFSRRIASSNWVDYTGPDAQTLEISYDTVPGDLWLEQMEGQKQYGMLPLIQGKAQAKVAKGNYALEIRGKTTTPSASFAFEITGPASAKWKPDPQLKSDAKSNILCIHSFRVSSFIVLLALGATAFSSASAQTPDSAQKIQMERQVTEEKLAERAPGAPFRSVAPVGYLLASKDGSKAVVSSGFDYSTAGMPNLTFKVEGTAPVSKDNPDDDVTIAGINGLGNGNTLTLAFGGTIWPGKPARPSELSKWCDANDAKLGISDCKNFSSAEIPDSVYPEFLRTAGWREPWVFELAGELAPSKYKYLDATSYKPSDVSKLSWSAGADFGKFAGASLWSAGLHYKVDYEAQPSADICVPITNATRCRTAPLGAPKETKTFVTRLQARAYVSTSVAFNPTYELDLDSRDFSLSLPIYFVPTKDGKIIAGLSPHFESENGTWSLDLFVGSALLSALK